MLLPMCIAATYAALLVGCTITKQGNGADDKVSIEAPGASVKVDTGTAANDSGIPSYPGAHEKPAKGDDKSRAHVNVNTPFVKVKVVTLTFISDDAPEKVLAFYRNKLGSYGTVLECTSGTDVELGNGRGLKSPVTCGKGNGDAGETSLKTGTEGNQHVVSVKPNGKGTEFELLWVYVGGKKDDDDFGGKQPS
jgi:hypothetical protein